MKKVAAKRVKKAPVRWCAGCHLANCIECYSPEEVYNPAVLAYLDAYYKDFWERQKLSTGEGLTKR